MKIDHTLNEIRKLTNNHITGCSVSELELVIVVLMDIAKEIKSLNENFNNFTTTRSNK